MGADFLLNYLTADHGQEIDLSAGCRALETLAGTPLDQWPADLLDSECINLEANARNGAEARRVLIDQLTADLSLLEAAIEDRRRDTWFGPIGNKSVVATGGMSWGDAPTEAYDAFNRLELAGITRAMGFDS